MNDRVTEFRVEYRNLVGEGPWRKLTNRVVLQIFQSTRATINSSNFNLSAIHLMILLKVTNNEAMSVVGIYMYG